MTIHFYLDNEEETEITSFYDVNSNPFKVGDVIYLTVDELYPIDYSKYKEDYQRKLIDDSDKLQQQFNRKEISIVRENKHISFKVANTPKLTVEYHCRFVDSYLVEKCDQVNL